MRALVARGFGDLVLEDVAEPAIGPGQVLVETKVSAVSAGTERRMLFGREGDVREHAPDFPVVGGFGYLAAGIVADVAPDVVGLKTGDRVSVGRAWGAHREFLDTDATSALPIPASMSYLEAAASYWAVPPFAGILAGKPRLYSDSAVIGLGPLGLAAVQILARSSRRVLAVDIVESRIAAAASYGAIAVDASAQAVKDALEADMPDGPEVVIEASGTQAGLELALDIVKPLGRVALVGALPPLKEMNLFWPLQHKGVHVVPLHRDSTSSPQGGGMGSPRQAYLPDVLGMISRGLLDIEGMTSWVVPVERGPEAFDLLRTRPDEVLGIGFSWDDEHNKDLERYESLVSGLSIDRETGNG